VNTERRTLSPQESLMSKLALFIVVAAALLLSPAFAQQHSAQRKSTLVGLPVYSSDGQKLGEVTDEGRTGGKATVRANMRTFFGSGPNIVLIDTDVFKTKADRIELTMTAAEVREKLPMPRQ
jgi:hypothetical protein